MLIRPMTSTIRSTAVQDTPWLDLAKEQNCDLEVQALSPEEGPGQTRGKRGVKRSLPARRRSTAFEVGRAGRGCPLPCQALHPPPVGWPLVSLVGPV